MKNIALSYDRKTLVDDQDYDNLIQWVWFAKRERNRWFAARRDGDGNIIYMHDVIAKPEEGWGVRHAEPYQTLNNTRGNLVRYRIETSPQPQPPKRPYRGVSEITLADGSRKYVPRISVNGKKIPLGRFDDPVGAAKAYDRADYQYNGKKALTRANFGDELLEYIKQQGEMNRSNNGDTERAELGRDNRVPQAPQEAGASRKAHILHRRGVAYEKETVSSLHRQ